MLQADVRDKKWPADPFPEHLVTMGHFRSWPLPELDLKMLETILQEYPHWHILALEMLHLVCPQPDAQQLVNGLLQSLDSKQHQNKNPCQQYQEFAKQSHSHSRSIMAQCYLTTDNSCLGIGKLAVVVCQKNHFPLQKTTFGWHCIDHGITKYIWRATAPNSYVDTQMLVVNNANIRGQILLTTNKAWRTLDSNSPASGGIIGGRSMGDNIGINIDGGGGGAIDADDASDGDDWLLLTMSTRPNAPLRLPMPPANLFKSRWIFRANLEHPSFVAWPTSCR